MDAFETSDSLLYGSGADQCAERLPLPLTLGVDIAGEDIRTLQLPHPGQVNARQLVDYSRRQKPPKAVRGPVVELT